MGDSPPFPFFPRPVSIFDRRAPARGLGPLDYGQDSGILTGDGDGPGNFRRAPDGASNMSR